MAGGRFSRKEKRKYKNMATTNIIFFNQIQTHRWNTKSICINKYKGRDESESDSYGVFISYKYIYEEMHIGIRGCL